MKKIITLTLVAIMLVAFAVPAMASAGDDILLAEIAKLEAQYADNAGAIKTLDDARIWLAENPGQISVADANAMVAEIEKAVTTAGSATHISQLSTAQINSMIASITAAAKVIGWTVDLNASNGNFTVKDADGNVVTTVATGNPIKATGIDAGMLIAIVVGVTILFGAAVIVSVVLRNKKNVIEASAA